jgi:hypothetical protein
MDSNLQLMQALYLLNGLMRSQLEDSSSKPDNIDRNQTLQLLSDMLRASPYLNGLILMVIPMSIDLFLKLLFPYFT